ncbi:MAG: TetR/AcrR family transcriptional regulator [Pseudomonadota bacterium]
MRDSAHPSSAPTDGRSRILDAAEAAFAADGFSGASMKAIADAAGVASGLLHYHFDGKEGLYAAVIDRRAGLINAERLAQLAPIDLGAPDAVRRILAALLGPPLGPMGGGRAYARILAGMTAGDARDKALVRAHYDEVAEAFIAALSQARPDASRAAVAWAYNLAIGTLVTALGSSDRAEQFAGQPVQDRLGTLITYVEGGLDALAAAPPD